MSVVDPYDKLVKKSIILDNYGNLTHNEIRTNKYIPCDDFENFYNDTYFYLHLHTALYVELLKYSYDINYDITSFEQLINNLKIKLDTSRSFSGTITVNNYVLIDKGNYNLDKTISVNLENYTPNTINSSASPTIGYGIDESKSSNELVNLFNTSKGSGLEAGNILVLTGPVGSTQPIELKITSVNNSGEITGLSIEKRGILSNGNPLSLSVTTLKSSAGTTISLGSGKAVPTSSLNVPLTKYINSLTVSYSPNANTFTSAPNFSFSPKQLGTGERPARAYITSSTHNNISSLDQYSGLFTINTNNLNLNYKHVYQYIPTDTKYHKIIGNKLPILQNLANLQTTFSIGSIFDSTDSTYNATNGFTKTSLDNFKPSTSTYDYSLYRKDKFKLIIKTLLQQKHTNILSYLSYQIKYYNIILGNTSIQKYIYFYYLNNSSLNMNNNNIFSLDAVSTNSLILVNTHIDNLTLDLDTMSKNTEDDNNIYNRSKEDYVIKIGLLNDSHETYSKNQESLNNAIKNYNSYLTNYKNLKVYASSIIIFLVLIIIVTIIITFLPSINVNSKNTYYIVILLLSIMITYYYYSNFSHISSYEKFTNATRCGSLNTYKTDYSDSKLNNANKANNADFFNGIATSLFNYRSKYNLLSQKMAASILTSDNKLFENNSNDYLNSLFIEKSRKADIFRIKRTNLNNLIEAMKEEVNYLYNIILLLCLLIIVLLVSLILYSNSPEYLITIMVLTVISIIIITYYFTFKIKQPTRMINNKNYWAHTNPTNEMIGKL
jgi:hypothetical protein